MARKAYRSEEELEAIFSRAGLRMIEPYDPSRSYPKNGYLLAECMSCHTQAHYRLAYLMDGDSSGLPTCGVCKWRRWYESSGSGKGGLAERYFASLAAQVEQETSYRKSSGIPKETKKSHRSTIHIRT